MAAIALTREQEQRLKRALLGDERLGMTELRMINTEAYKIRLGDDWFKYKDIINSYAVQAIKANLTGEDIFVPTKNGFAVFFFSASEEKVAAAAETMAQDISQLLSREKVFQDPPVSCVARPMTRSEFIGEIDIDVGLGNHNTKRDLDAPMGAVERRTTGESGRLDSGYHPLWHGKAQRVVGCINEPESSAPFVGDHRYYESSAQHVSYDIETFNKVLSHVYKLHKARETAVIIFSINFKSFCAPEFNKEYLLAMRQTPASLIPFLLPRFVRIPPGAPSSLIATKAQIVTSIFKKLVLQPPLEGDLRRFEYTTCTVIAASMKEAIRVSRLPVVHQQSVGPLLNSFVHMAKSMRYNALITGVDTLEGFELAVQAKADFISGAAIGPYTQLPVSQFHLGLDEIRGTSRQKAG